MDTQKSLNLLCLAQVCLLEIEKDKYELESLKKRYNEESEKPATKKFLFCHPVWFSENIAKYEADIEIKKGEYANILDQLILNK